LLILGEANIHMIWWKWTYTREMMKLLLIKLYILN